MSQTYQASADGITIEVVPALELAPGDIYIDNRGDTLQVVNRSQRCGYIRLQTRNLSNARAWGDWEVKPMTYTTRIRGLV